MTPSKVLCGKLKKMCFEGRMRIVPLIETEHFFAPVSWIWANGSQQNRDAIKIGADRIIMTCQNKMVGYNAVKFFMVTLTCCNMDDWGYFSNVSKWSNARE